MYSTHEQKYRFVQNRVELDHTRRLNSQTGIARLERPGSLFDGGYDDAFGEADDDGDGPEAGSEAVAPLVASLVALQAMPDAAGALGPTIAEIKRKIGKAKGGGKGGGARAPGRQTGQSAGGRKGAGGTKDQGGSPQNGGGQGGGGRAPVPPEFLKTYFDKGCRYCGDLTHRRAECPKLARDLQAKGLRAVQGTSAPEIAGEDAWYLNLLDEASTGAKQLGCISRWGPTRPSRATSGI